MNTNFDSAKKYINLKRTHGHESLCGPGSHKCNTRDVVKFINDSIKKYNVKSILDLGCGDWNWFNEIELDDCTYIGWDCDEEMISRNTRLYGTDLIMFETKDIVTSEYPNVDMVICRDVLFHLDEKLTLQILNKIKSNCNYFVSTSFNDVSENTNIKKYNNVDGWGYYQINLSINPFCLIAAESIIEKKIQNQRSVCLYKFDG